VKSGECTQTIRLHNPDRPKKLGDKLILHTWEGRPYFSKWDWRMETKVSESMLLLSQWEWFGPLENRHHMVAWKLYTGREELFTPEGKPYEPARYYHHYQVFKSEEVEEIIRRDGILPVEYNQLEKTLESLNGLGSTDQNLWDIIRWSKATEE
jgi:hypothetical protein